jgi:site-specific DNA recombinase
MRAARERQFDVVLCEALDRLSRDQADLARLKKELAFLDIGIMTVQDGEVGAMHIGLKGLMGEMYLADLAQKTRRGLSARVRAGGSGGGRSFGYDPAQGRAGGMTINPHEAEIVRRIFADYLDGRTPRQIVSDLNAAGVPGPRGGKWNASTINGSRSRQNGVLQNRLYAGEIVWNRQRFIKDPATGKRVSRLNPESDWLISPVPELAIVDAETFAAAQQRKAGRSITHPDRQRVKKPTHILSGLLRCGVCGASYTVMGTDRLGCAGHRERGDCSNTRTVSRKHIEERVLVALQTRLAEPEAVAEYVRTYRAELARLRAEGRRDRHKSQRRLAELTTTIERIVDRVCDGTASDALVARLEGLEAEQKTLRAAIAAQDAADEPIELHPGAAQAYAQMVGELRHQFAGAPFDRPTEAIVEKVRGLIDRIEITPGADSKKPVDIMVHGLLAQLLLASAGAPFSPMYGSGGCGDRI